MEIKIRWYHYLWLWTLKTQKAVDMSTKRGKTLTVTMYYKELNDHIYVMNTEYKTTQASGKHNRRLRRNES